MDNTQGAPPKTPGTGRMLVTTIGLSAGNIGFAAGIFGRLAGDQTLYTATATGAGVATAALALGLTIASFVRKDDEG
ncbi:hypothetical protein PV728_31995 [Streptomyces europaeiscabiei]|uniref:hypothetical protein n=1 Tax=Streptomyces europaeiscabiei TaxID=146819 RepID=UPI0029B93A84|nr:hypothetical protein [Streptomyces europaeiscabiei]MDX3634800.1 hypothetical protein [Streptomyces europaeiscabiei]MDX3652756.1 hypothetical protein [Streptomyces europaeiscabiei]